jgi:hypothetical protein
LGKPDFSEILIFQKLPKFPLKISKKSLEKIKWPAVLTRYDNPRHHGVGGWYFAYAGYFMFRGFASGSRLVNLLKKEREQTSSGDGYFMFQGLKEREQTSSGGGTKQS